MEAVSNGRALPPRPTLLVGQAGDVNACKVAWRQLRPSAEELLRRAEVGCASIGEFDSAVRRFRSLRESLVAAYIRDDLAIQVYECSADVCLAARCWPEFLKSVVALTNDIYPANAHKQYLHPPQQQWGAAALSRPSSPPSPAGNRESKQHETDSNSSSSIRKCSVDDDNDVALVGRDSGGPSSCLESSCSSSMSCRSSSRSAEMAAVHVMFLACAPPGCVADAAAQLRNLRTLSYLTSESSGPAGGCGQRLLKFTLQALSSLTRGDWLAFLRLAELAPLPSLKAVMELRAPMVRQAALRALLTAFRSLPASGLVEALALRGETQSQPALQKSSAQANGPIRTAVAEIVSTSASTSARESGDAGDANAPNRGPVNELRLLLTLLHDAAEAAGGGRARMALEGLCAGWSQAEARAECLELRFRS